MFYMGWTKFGLKGIFDINLAAYILTLCCKSKTVNNIPNYSQMVFVLFPRIVTVTYKCQILLNDVKIY